MLLVLPDSPCFTVVEATDICLQVSYLKRSEVIGKSLWEVFPETMETENEKGRENVAKSLDRAISTKAPVDMAVQFYPIPHPDGKFEIKHWSMLNIPVLSPTGEVELLINRAIDVTELVLAKRGNESLSEKVLELSEEVTKRSNALKESNEKLLEANEALGLALRQAQMANIAKANLSHELRTPLNGIIGFAQLLERDQDIRPESRKYIEHISTAASHLLNLVNDLLDLAKASSGKLMLHVQSVNLPYLILETVAIFKPRVLEKNLSLEVTLSDDFPTVVTIDPLRFRQILLNILSNAVKFTEKGKVVITGKIVSIEHLHGHPKMVTLEVAVSDTGIGIDASKISSLFQRFEQVGENEVPGGTGLGLSIALELARLMNGTIGVQSTVGVGSVFTIRIKVPCSEMVETSFSGCKKLEAHHSSLVAEETASGEVLVVDDLELNRTVLVRLLQHFGFKNIITANDGEEALTQCRLHKFKFVLTDIFMPRMGGPELLARLRQLAEYSNTPIIAVTAYNVMDDDRMIASLSGFNAVLYKPAELGRLHEALEACGAEFRHVGGKQDKVKILLVDDQAIVRKLIKSSLSKGDYEIQEISSGPDALKELEHNEFDVVLLDRVMPGMDGFETAELIKKSMRHPPMIILMSATFCESDYERGNELRLDGMIEKPFSLDSFKKVLDAACERLRMLITPCDYGGQ